MKIKVQVFDFFSIQLPESSFLQMIIGIWFIFYLMVLLEVLILVHTCSFSSCTLVNLTASQAVCSIPHILITSKTVVLSQTGLWICKFFHSRSCGSKHKSGSRVPFSSNTIRYLNSRIHMSISQHIHNYHQQRMLNKTPNSRFVQSVSTLDIILAINSLTSAKNHYKPGHHQYFIWRTLLPTKWKNEVRIICIMYLKFPEMIPLHLMVYFTDLTAEIWCQARKNPWYLAKKVMC